MKQIEEALYRKARSLKPGKKLKLSKPAPMRHPTEIERRYYKELQKTVVSELYSMVKRYLLPILPDALEKGIAIAKRNDRFDGFAEDIDIAFGMMRVQFARYLTTREVIAMIDRSSDAVQEFSRATLAATTMKVLGLDPLENAPSLRQAAEKFTRTNTALIRSIGEKFHTDLEFKTMEFVSAGVYNMEYADRIKSQYADEFKRQYEAKILKHEVKNIDARARLIARDQISKYNGDLTRVRQTDLGLSKYRWSTAGDDRVRDSHREKNGRIYSWDSPPSDTGHPGDDYQCRCIAIPVFDVGVTDNPQLLKLLNS